MNDYWNDPPEHPEPPECCGEEMDIHDDGSCECVMCGKRIEPPPDIEPVTEPDYSEADWQNHYAIPASKCRHGRDPQNCDACDHAADIAYDEERERRIFSR